MKKTIKNPKCGCCFTEYANYFRLIFAFNADDIILEKVKYIIVKEVFLVKLSVI